MSGHPMAIEQGLQVLHRGGWMSLLGIGDRPVTLDLNDLVVTKGITIYGIFGRRIWDSWERTSSYLSTGKVDVSPLITHRFPLDDFQEAMAQMRAAPRGKSGCYPTAGWGVPRSREKKTHFSATEPAHLRQQRLSRPFRGLGWAPRPRA